LRLVGAALFPLRSKDCGESVLTNLLRMACPLLRLAVRGGLLARLPGQLGGSNPSLCFRDFSSSLKENAAAVSRKLDVSIIDRSCCGASVRLRCILCLFELAESPRERCNAEDIQSLLATYLETHTRSQEAGTCAHASTEDITQATADSSGLLFLNVKELRGDSHRQRGGTRLT
jgi:hypothetical protein